jgi:acetolactate synthase-1/2/3 large subunit
MSGNQATGKPATGARLIVDALLAQGTGMVFCVPGESYLAVLDALHDEAAHIRVVTCRHEAGAANMADAHARLTGRPGVAFVTRGPGVTHASIALHTARQDSTPLVLFIGQVPRGHMEREAFQEIEYRRFLTEVTKWVAVIDDPARVPEMVARAFQVASSGRPGPVALVLPEDMQHEGAAPLPARQHVPAQPVAGATDVAALAGMLGGAQRPLLVAGGPGWTADASRRLQHLAEAARLPVLTAFRRQDLIDNRSPAWAGTLGLNLDPATRGLVREADLVVALGTQWTEIASQGYGLFPLPDPGVAMVQVGMAAEEMGRIYQTDLAILSAPGALLEGLEALGIAGGPARAGWFDRWSANLARRRVETPSAGPVNMAEVILHLDQVLPEDAIITNGAGNYSVWLHRFYRHKRYGTQLAPQNGAMGYGVPAAVAAALACPGRGVVCLAGDGCFLMSGQELATARQYGAKLVVLVVNNGSYGTIRTHQERHFPGRVSATDLVNPDFAALARAYGLSGETVTATGQFAAAFGRAMAHDGPALIELVTGPEDLAPGVTVTGLRGA